MLNRKDNVWLGDGKVLKRSGKAAIEIGFGNRRSSDLQLVISLGRCAS